MKNKKCIVCFEIKIINCFNKKQSKCKVCQKKYNDNRKKDKKCIICGILKKANEFDKFYRTCKTCKKLNIKKCCECKKIKSIDNFRKNSRNKCYECEIIYCNKYNEINKEKIKNSKKAYRENNKEKRKKEARIYIENFPREYLWGSAFRRAKKRNEKFLLKVEDIIIPEICPLLNIKMQINKSKAKDNSYSIDKIDPNKLYEKNNVWVISHKANSSKNNASIEEYKMLVNNLEKIIINGININDIAVENDIINQSFNNAKTRATRNNLKFFINKEYLKYIYPIDNKCPLFNTELKKNNNRFCMNSASLDRIIPKKGYVEGNIMFISFKANIIKNNLTLEELKLLLKNWEIKKKENK